MERLLALARSGSCDARFNWVLQLRNLAVSCGSELSLDDMSNPAVLISNIDTVLIRGSDFFQDSDLVSVLESRYSEARLPYDRCSGPQQYLTLSWSHRLLRPVAQIRRAGSHNARILVNGLSARFNAQERCPLCNWKLPNSIVHFLFECPLLTNPRVKCLAPLMNPGLTPIEQYEKLLTSQ
ncbi:Hypothetical protein NTJ_02601 [Nesidiocoris tenuis]|uniref:Reverse transcriptase zinc-binding domain-containing protein n=1 Tax=Nesidiocoris tenuis TaxID=355587 RepID=A0ABN7AEL3_9HEMI|nr:Hypothetical protein NTJ_02601 [Nesidiocoris tenuis]